MKKTNKLKKDELPYHLQFRNILIKDKLFVYNVKVGDKIYHKDHGAGVVVGYSERSKCPIFHFPNTNSNSNSMDKEESIHSSMIDIVNKNKLFAFRFSNKKLSFLSNKILKHIEKETSPHSSIPFLKVGDLLTSTNGSWTINHFNTVGDPYTIDNALIVRSCELNTRISKINNVDTKEYISKSINKNIENGDDEIVASLKRWGYSIGQRVKLTTPNEDAIIVGFKQESIGFRVAVKIINRPLRNADTTLKECRGYIHSKYKDSDGIKLWANTNYTIIPFSKKELDKVIIEDQLYEIGLKVGDKVEVSADSLGKPNLLADIRKSATVKIGTVIGIKEDTKLPIIMFDNIGWKTIPKEYNCLIHPDFNISKTDESGAYYMELPYSYRKLQLKKEMKKNNNDKSTAKQLIVDILSKRGLKLGDKVKVSADSSNNPHPHLDISKSGYFITGSIIGVYKDTELPIIEFDLPKGWKTPPNEKCLIDPDFTFSKNGANYIENEKAFSLITTANTPIKKEEVNKTILPPPNLPVRFNLKVGDQIELLGGVRKGKIIRTQLPVFTNKDLEELVPIIKYDDLALPDISELKSLSGVRSINGVLTDAGKIEASKIEKEKSNQYYIFPSVPIVPITIMLKQEKNQSQFSKEVTATSYRVAATQAITLSKNLLINMLELSGKNNEYIASISNLLDTEFGRSFVAMSLGIGISHLSSSSNDNDKLNKFAKECRIQSMTTLGNTIIDNVASSVLEALKQDNPLNKDEVEYQDEFDINSFNVDDELLSKRV